MNSDDLIQVLQTGMHVTIGATTSLLEVLQDPDKRQENLAKLSQEWNQLSEAWAEKGIETEREARGFVDTLFSRQSHPPSSTASADPMEVSTPDTPVDAAAAPSMSSAIQQEVQALTAQLAAMRAELERLRTQTSNSDLDE